MIALAVVLAALAAAAVAGLITFGLAALKLANARTADAVTIGQQAANNAALTTRAEAAERERDGLKVRVAGAETTAAANTHEEIQDVASQSTAAGAIAAGLSHLGGARVPVAGARVPGDPATTGAATDPAAGADPVHGGR